jgi:hypothetical protein
MKTFQATVNMNAQQTAVVEADSASEAAKKFNEGEYELTEGSLEATGIYTQELAEDDFSEVVEPL